MSLLPILLSDCWDEFQRPRSFLDHHYGITMRPEDLFDSHSSRDAADILVYRPLRKLTKRFHPYETKDNNNKSHGASIVNNDKDKFHVTLDVQHFQPEEITVKAVGNTIVVEGKHEEKEDDHGWISRQFSRKYLIPSQCDVDKVTSSLSSDGVLTITAPRKSVPAVENREKIIEIQRTGAPAVEDNKAPGQPIGTRRTEQGAEQNGIHLDAGKKKKTAAA